jgi:hypothetical protein
VKAAETLDEMRATGETGVLLERILLAEAVIDAAKGPESTERTVAAIEAYEAQYGDVPATYVPDFPSS